MTPFTLGLLIAQVAEQTVNTKGQIFVGKDVEEFLRTINDLSLTEYTLETTRYQFYGRKVN